MENPYLPRGYKERLERLLRQQAWRIRATIGGEFLEVKVAGWDQRTLLEAVAKVLTDTPDEAVICISKVEE